LSWPSPHSHSLLSIWMYYTCMHWSGVHLSRFVHLLPVIMELARREPFCRAGILGVLFHVQHPYALVQCTSLTFCAPAACDHGVGTLRAFSQSRYFGCIVLCATPIYTDLACASRGLCTCCLRLWSQHSMSFLQSRYFGCVVPCPSFSF
jgi:hypothetical protein